MKELRKSRNNLHTYITANKYSFMGYGSEFRPKYLLETSLLHHHTLLHTRVSTVPSVLSYYQHLADCYQISYHLLTTIIITASFNSFYSILTSSFIY
jgi:hypothetical protein